MGAAAAAAALRRLVCYGAFAAVYGLVSYFLAWSCFGSASSPTHPILMIMLNSDALSVLVAVYGLFLSIGLWVGFWIMGCLT